MSDASDSRDRFIRNVDDALYRQARILALEQGVTVGEIVNAALAEYLGRYADRVAHIKQRGVER